MGSSQKKIEANRRNAKKSTGPVTSKGKAKASKNSIKHGLYASDIIIQSEAFSESTDQYNALVASMVEELKPVGRLEEHLVSKIANGVWRSKRVVRAETAHIKARMDEIPEDIDHALLLKQIKLPTYERDDCALTDEERERVEENSVGKNTIPDSNTSRYLLLCEMRLDRQLSRAYRLLELVQARRARNQEKSRSKRGVSSQTSDSVFPDISDHYSNDESLAPGVSYVDE